MWTGEHPILRFCLLCQARIDGGQTQHGPGCPARQFELIRAPDRPLPPWLAGVAWLAGTVVFLLLVLELFQ